ncbi:7833_t:CDS:2 [Ambispora leptoticha]|uniref:7833_t:CDS:1 n=1 Tax=Ambispora leptoticha TaxID=144679 RepID=A0A9N9A1G3_9GLOM|nr:7833_t:CDS:2 [Ambispora leptoticha]
MDFSTIYQFVLTTETMGNKSIYSPLLTTASETYWQLRFDPDMDNNIIVNYLTTAFGYDSDSLGVRNFYARISLPFKFVIGVEFNVDISGEKITSIPIDYSQNLKKAWMNDLNNPSTSDVKFTFENENIFASSKILASHSKYFESMFSENCFETENSVLKFREVNVLEEFFQNLLKKPAKASKMMQVNKCLEPKLNIKEKLNEKDMQEENKCLEPKLNIKEKLEEKYMQEDNNCLEPNLKLIKTKEKINVFDYEVGIYKTDYEVEIYKTDPALFLQMLVFLYTGEIIYKNDDKTTTYENALDLYGIANKYSLNELKMKTKEFILASLTLENSAKILFKSAYKWPELRKEVKEFVVENFSEVSKTAGYEQIIKNQEEYAAFFEINTEILLSIYKKE